MAMTPDPGSSSNSTIGLENVSLNSSMSHPEQWTLPKEWNMEKRELFDDWKLDVQHQIKNLEKKLHVSLKQYPQHQNQIGS